MYVTLLFCTNSQLPVYTILLPVYHLCIHAVGQAITYIQTIDTSIKRETYCQNNVVLRETNWACLLQLICLNCLRSDDTQFGCGWCTLPNGLSDRLPLDTLTFYMMSFLWLFRSSIRERCVAVLRWFSTPEQWRKLWTAIFWRNHDLNMRRIETNTDRFNSKLLSPGAQGEIIFVVSLKHVKMELMLYDCNLQYNNTTLFHIRVWICRLDCTPILTDNLPY